MVLLLHLFLQLKKKRVPNKSLLTKEEKKLPYFERIHQVKCEGMTTLLMYSYLQIKLLRFFGTIMSFSTFIFLA